MDLAKYKSFISGIFDRTAESYGKNYNSFFDYFASNLVKLASISKDSYVLDVATGRGAILKKASEIASQGKMVGIDISPLMIEKASKEFKNHLNVQLICRDAEHLEFDKNTFDYLFCGFGLYFFPNLSNTLKEFLRVLKPGGKLLVSTWGKDDVCDHVFAEAYNEIAGTLERVIFNSFENLNGLYEELSKVGFSEIKIVSDELDHIYPTVDDWFFSKWSHLSRACLEKLSNEQISKLRYELNARLLPYLKSDGLHERMNAHYTTAIKAV